jgi:hypothetical protein
VSQPATCSGDQFNRSLLATACRIHGLFANLQRFGRRVRAQAFSSANAARYPLPFNEERTSTVGVVMGQSWPSFKKFRFFVIANTADQAGRS